MGARSKLNQITTVGCVILAAIIGGASGSWGVFFLVLIILLGLCLYSQEIRLDQGSGSSPFGQGGRRRRRYR